MTLNQAIALACRQHEGQLDKCGQRYILHPLSVMFNLIKVGITNETYLKVAVLHDVAEDTSMTIIETDMWKTLTAEEKEALDLLNRNYPKKLAGFDTLNLQVKEENYEEYIGRISNNEIATKVKIADLRHNLDLDRMIKVNEFKNPLDFNLRRINKYLMALKTLEEIDAMRGQK